VAAAVLWGLRTSSLTTLAAPACTGLLKGETAGLCAELEKLRPPFRDWMARVRDCCMVREAVPQDYYTLWGAESGRE
jgi:hypothetical protein